MLTEEQLELNKANFLKLLSTLELTDKSVDMCNLLAYLNTVKYFEQPLTAQNNGAYVGGLCEYALRVYQELSWLANAYCPNMYTQEDIIKVALFKDIYKAELYETYNRNVKDETTGKWYSKKEYRTKEERPTFGDLGFSSYMIAKHFMSFTDTQIEAIVHASLGLENNNRSKDLYNVLDSYKLVSLTHMADIAATYLGAN